MGLLEWLRRIFFPVPAPGPSPTPVPVPVPGPEPAPDPQPNDELSTMRAQLLAAHNAHRSNPLTMNVILNLVAQKHSVWMAGHSMLHSEYGVSPFQRMMAAGYRFSYAGENIAISPTVERVMNAWLRSPLHHANIVNERYQEVGFGVYQDNNGMYWWTVDFGTPGAPGMAQVTTELPGGIGDYE